MGLRRGFQCRISGLARTLASLVLMPREVMGSHRKMRIRTLHVAERPNVPLSLPVKMSKFVALLAAVTLAVTVRAQSTVSTWGQCGGSVSICTLCICLHLGCMLTFHTSGLDGCDNMRVWFCLYRPQHLCVPFVYSPDSGYYSAPL